VSPVRGTDAKQQFALCQRVCAKYGFDILSTFCIGWREMHHIAMIIFDKGDPENKKNALLCMRELISEAAEMGYGEYRTHLILQDQVARTYNWNNNVRFLLLQRTNIQALLRFNEALKDALDPVGVLSPGRNGIWPRNYRGKGFEILPNTTVAKALRETKL
jgi:FAD linked oxidases, C-terminal domain